VIYKPAAKASTAAPIDPPAETTRTDRSKAVLVLKVPADADVYLVGQKMTITGTERRFRIPLADPSKEYTYPVRVEVKRDGKTLVSETKQKLRGGQMLEVAVAESDSAGELVTVAMR